MFKHKTADGKHNISGNKVFELRKKLPGKVSQRMLAEQMQLIGLDMDKTAIRRIENGERYITDIELKAFCEFFNVNANYFLNLSTIPSYLKYD